MSNLTERARAWIERWRSAGGVFWREKAGSARFGVLDHMDDNDDMRRSRRAVLSPMIRELNGEMRVAVLNLALPSHQGAGE